MYIYIYIHIHRELYCFQLSSYDNLTDSWTTHAVIRGSNRLEKISVKTSELRLTYTRYKFSVIKDDNLDIIFNITYKVSLPKNTGKFGRVPEYTYRYLLVIEGIQGVGYSWIMVSCVSSVMTGTFCAKHVLATCRTSPRGQFIVNNSTYNKNTC